MWLRRATQRKRTKDGQRVLESESAPLPVCVAFFCMCVFALVTTELQVRAGWACV